MERTLYFAIFCLLFSVVGSAQKAVGFQKPKDVLPAVFLKEQADPLKSIISISLQTTLKSIAVSKSPNANLPLNYDWVADINRTQSLKFAAFEVQTQDCLGRDILPDMADMVLQQFLIKNSSVKF